MGLSSSVIQFSSQSFPHSFPGALISCFVSERASPQGASTPEPSPCCSLCQSRVLPCPGLERSGARDAGLQC